MQKKKFKLFTALAVLLLIVVPGLVLLVGKLEGDPPEIRLDPDPQALGVSQEISFFIADSRSGLRQVWVGLVRGEKETVLAERRFSGDAADRDGDAGFEVKLPILPQKMGIGDGPVLLRVKAADRSWRNWFHGNRALFEKTLSVDTKPPQVEVLTQAHHINQGGSGLILYRLSEPCRESGVKVGEHFYPGRGGLFPDGALMAAFFALEPQQGPGTPLQLMAADAAGNVTRRGFPHLIKPKVFKQDRIPLGDEFLNAKMPEFDVPVPAGSPRPMLDKFLAVNRQMRERDHRTLTALGVRSANKLYWQGAFLRLPNSAPRAGFADQRDYLYQNASVDRQMHLGVDLASLAHSPIPAANAGKVVLAEDVGIYGRTVAVDHGFGLVSLYSHLSHIEVQVGQEIAKGEILGKTGTTGMAAGDHLHYSMLIHDTFVNPIEWWDDHWINDNVSSKVEAAGSDKPTGVALPPPVERKAAAAPSSGAPPRKKKGARRP